MNDLFFLDVVKSQMERRRYVQRVGVRACVEAKLKKEKDDEKKEKKRQAAQE